MNSTLTSEKNTLNQKISVQQNSIEQYKSKIEDQKNTIEQQQIKILQQDSTINDLNKTVEDLKKKLASKNNISEKGRRLLSRGGDMPETKYLGVFAVTFYTPFDGSSTGKTAMGNLAVPDTTVAVDPRIVPLGTKLYIEDFGVVVAQDTGSAIRGNKIDYCVSSRALAYQLGKKQLKIWVVR